MIEAGIDTCQAGRASWCRLCDTTRHTVDMRWLSDLYACRWCMPEAVHGPYLIDWGSSETVDGGVLVPIFAAVPRRRGSDFPFAAVAAQAEAEIEADAEQIMRDWGQPGVRAPLWPECFDAGSRR